MYALKMIVAGLIFAAILAVSPAMAGTGAETGAEARFFSMLNDMPLMPGLAELPARATAFDKPEGRIAEASAAGAVQPDRIRTFYEVLLPQLGWVKENDGVYGRQDERLTMRTATENGNGVVRFSIAPK